MSTLRHYSPDVLLLVGVGAALYGIGRLSIAAAWIAGGLVAIVGAIYLARTEAP